MKQSGLSLPLSFIIWRRHNFLWDSFYLTLVLPPVTEIGLLLLHRALLTLSWWFFSSENEMVKLLWLSRCLSFSLLLQTSWPLSKGEPRRTEHVEGKDGEIGPQAIPHSFQRLSCWTWNTTDSPTNADRATLFQLLFPLFVSSKRLTLLWERTLREQVKFKQHPALKHSGYGREHLCHCILNRH